jgi:TPP-dependent pyruvate/acetoin dehydrogenase alpha subunit
MNQLKEKKMPPKYSKKYQKEALEDFRIACISREASLMGRKEVLTGKAKFGIFGAGKEIAQLAMARVFKKGDFRSGYYRGQTFMLATGWLRSKTYLLNCMPMLIVRTSLFPRGVK